MARFVLTAQLQLQAPTNTRQVVGEIRNQLAGQAIRVPVEVQGARQAQTAVQDVTNEVRKATNAADALGRSFGLAIKRFAAFTVASRAVSLFTNSLAGAVDEAIQFQREVIKIAQVTGASDNTLKGLTKTITDLSTGLGVVSSDLLAVTRILSQAGVRGRDLEVALESLAKSTLAPTFDDITQTAEGAVAILAQFQKGTGALESQLGSINAVAGAFAVESGDLIGAVRRFGGVFKSAGGSLEELLAIFTSVRQTTRESAESISTGLRTIFTRIQRPETIRFLKQLGVELQDAEGRFVGPIEAVEKLGKKFADLEQGDLQFIRIAEELGGFRQIGKVIPLIQQYEVSLEALKVAQDGQGSLANDTAKAQEALAVQITKVKEEFLALVRSIAESTSFQLFTRTALELASALIKIADAVKPLLPLLGSLAAIKFTQGLGGFFAGAGASIRGLQGRNAGGKILGFARGGFVPGTGNRDTVPAMLQPGEFVIKKSSAQKLGASTLTAMNENRYAKGGLVVNELDSNQFAGLFARPKAEDASGKLIAIPPRQGVEGDDVLATIGAPKSYFMSNTDEETFTNAASTKLENGINDLVKELAPNSANEVNQNILNDLGVADIAGKIFEGVTRTIIGDFSSGSGSQQGFDIPRGKDAAVYQELGNLFNAQTPLRADVDYDNKLTESLGSRRSLLKKALNAKLPMNEIKIATFSGQGKNLSTAQLTAQQATVPNKDMARQRIQELNDAREKIQTMGLDQETLDVIDSRLKSDRAKLLRYTNKRTVAVRKKNSGGSIGGTDTVPALLTPGEFVVNKKAAQSIGYGNLASMNRDGVQRFQDGGAVGKTSTAPKKKKKKPEDKPFDPTSLFALTAVAASAQAAISELGDASAEASDGVAATTIGLEKGLNALIQVLTIFQLTKRIRAGIQKWTNATEEGADEQEAASGTVGNSLQSLDDKVNKLDITRVQAQSVTVEGKDAAKSPDAEAVTQTRPEPSLDELAPSTKQVNQRLEQAEADRLASNRPAAKTALLETDEELRDEEKLRSAKREENKGLQQEILTAKERQTEAVVQKRGLEERQRTRASEGASFDELTELEKQIGALEEVAAQAGDEIDNNSAKIKENLNAIKESSNRTSELKDDQKLYAAALKESQNALNPVSKNLDKLNVGAKRLSASFKDRSIVLYRNSIEKISSVTKKNFPTFTRGARRLGKGVDALTKRIRNAGAGVTSLAQKIRDLAGSTRASFGPGGRGRRVVGSVANTGAAAIGAVTAIAAVGAQIAQGFEQWFKRAEEQARASDNIAGAIEAAGTASVAQSFGDVFTVGGYIEAVSDPEGFVERRVQRKESAEFEAAQSFIGPRLQAQLDTLDPTLGASQEDRDNAARGTIEAFARTRSELSDLAPEQRDKALLAFNKQARDAIKSLDGAGVSIDELRSTAINLTGTDRKLRESLLKQVAAIEQSRKVQAELNKANLQSLQITSAFGAANAAVANFAAGLETGSSTLGGYINTLQQAQSGVGIDASAAIDAIEKDLVDSATAAGADVLADDVRGQANVARASTGFAAAAGGAVENLRLSANNPEAARAKLEERLRQAIPQGTSREVKEQIGNVISKNVQALGNDLSQVDLSDVVTKISQDSQALAKGFFEAAKLQDQHNQAITKLYQQREQIEAKVAESLNKAIDVQLEAAKNFESFGGARLTGDQQLSARIAQFNNVGGLAGVGLRTGDAQDIQRVAAEIGNVFNNSQQTFVNDIVARSTRGGGPGVFAGPEGFQKDQRPEAQRSNDQLLKFTRQRIQLLREELKIVKAKNQEEKNALDKLISGDIEGFIKGQAAAGAGAALRSGSSGLTSLFSASALGAGFKSLEGQGLTDAQKGRAEQLTLERFGLQSQGILSGTTAEERELNAQGRELSQIEGQLGAQAAQFAKSEIAVNEATIIATKLTFQNELQNVANRNANFVAPPPPQTNRWMGGPIYANRGMFVPRGTDTVPAMLTPGEFVVNRSAVQRGNNLQILRAMNSQGGASSPNAKSGGGRVYYNTGGVVEGISSAFQDSLPALRNVFDGFSQAVDRLANTQFSVKLDTTNVNVNLNGASFLATMKEDIKRELLDEVSREIGKAKPNSNGDMELRNTVL